MPQTEDLCLRPACQADVSDLYSFMGDPTAMRFTHVDLTLRECQRRVMVHEFFRRHDGAAPWVVRKLNTSRIIGWGGLYQDPFEPGWGFEVGYFFHPAAWGKGYASQLVAAALAVADEQLNLREVSAMAHPDNWASQRVLEKAGFALSQLLPSRPRLLYRRKR